MNNKSLSLHEKLKGKIEVTAKKKIKSKNDLSLIYTPGVGEVSAAIAKNKSLARLYTIKQNSVAVVSDGSAVLGLGNIGPEAALSVMEGKCVIFKEFAGIDAWPIVLDVSDAEDIISVVKAIAPGFGAINLEDISAPKCFEVEERLKKELSIPVMHDDQHGTAVAVLAGLINAFRLTGKDIKKSKIVISGAGAAGSAVANLLLKFGIKNIIVLDSKGIIGKYRKDLNVYKKELAGKTNPKKITGKLFEALEGADAFIGVSAPGIFNPRWIKEMNEKPIIFSLANPVPEIMPDLAKKYGAFITATGRSDFANQINNALVFPGIFRGILDGNIRKITDKIKIRAALALASLVKSPSPREIIPDIFNKNTVRVIAKAVNPVRKSAL